MREPGTEQLPGRAGQDRVGCDAAFTSVERMVTEAFAAGRWETFPSGPVIIIGQNEFHASIVQKKTRLQKCRGGWMGAGYRSSVLAWREEPIKPSQMT